MYSSCKGLSTKSKCQANKWWQIFLPIVWNMRIDEWKDIKCEMNANIRRIFPQSNRSQQVNKQFSFCNSWLVVVVCRLSTTSFQLHQYFINCHFLEVAFLLHDHTGCIMHNTQSIEKSLGSTQLTSEPSSRERKLVEKARRLTHGEGKRLKKLSEALFLSLPLLSVPHSVLSQHRRMIRTNK